MIITPEIVGEFVAYYPEFSDEYTWSAELLTKFLSLADDETSSSRWGGYVDSSLNYSFKKRGMFAYAAHRALLDERARAVAEGGGIAPGAKLVSSKSVGDESISYAVSSPMSTKSSESTGDLNTTHYGIEFLRLRSIVGVGATVV